MPDDTTQNGDDFDQVLDLAIELGDLARRVRRERRTTYGPGGLVSTWERIGQGVLRPIFDDTIQAGASDADA